jgi:hypothetical protein
MVAKDFWVITALVESKDKELTIHQISKIIKKSYAFTNKYAHDLIKRGVIKKKIIGPSILCSLNFANEETIASLVYISMLRKSGYKTNEKQCVAIGKYSKIGILIHYGEKIILISDEKIKDTMLTIMPVDKFLADARNYAFPSLTILSNHEQFWKLIAKVMP